MINKYKNIIIIAIIIAGALIAYSFFKPSPTQQSLLTTTERQNSAQVLGDQITSAINQINSLKLDRSIFDDPVFNNLVDHNKPILPKPIGRNNPFAPIGSDSGSTGASTQKTASSTTSTSTSKSTSTPGSGL